MISDQNPVTTFFQAYQEVLQSGESDALTRIYHESFLFGGTAGAQTVDRAAFLTMVPKRTAFVKSLGLTETLLGSVDSSALDERYTLAKVVWVMKVEKTGKPVQHLEASATYVLLRFEDSFRIVVQIDHQDLLAELNALGAT